jgi:hypothetical protein
MEKRSNGWVREAYHVKDNDDKDGNLLQVNGEKGK